MSSGRGSGIEHVAARVRGVRAVITSVVLLGFLVAVLTAMLVAVFRDTVLVEPIGAPQELVQRGYTPQVIAYRLMDEVMAIRLEYKSMKDGRAITADWTQADIQIPTTGISFKSFLSEVRRLFGIPETRIAAKSPVTRMSFGFGCDSISPGITDIRSSSARPAGWMSCFTWGART